MHDSRNDPLSDALGDGHLDEGTIHAWLDAALSPDESAAAQAHIASCERCAAAVAEARGLIAASARILSALDDVPAGVIPNATPASVERILAAAKRAQPAPAPKSRGSRADARPSWSVRRYAPIAAAIAFIAVGVIVVAHPTTTSSRISTVSESPREMLPTPPGPSAPAPNGVLPGATPAPARLQSPPAAAVRDSSALRANVNAVAPTDALAADKDVLEKEKKEQTASAKPEMKSLKRGLAASGARVGDSVAAFGANHAVAGAAGPTSSLEQRRALATRNEAPAEAAKSSVANAPKQLAEQAQASPTADRKDDRALDAAAATGVVGGAASAGRALQRPSAQPPAAPPAGAPARANALVADASRAPGGTITGRVTDAFGKPLTAASVVVVGTRSGATTNAAGEFTLRDVPAGRQTITARRIGFAPTSLQVDAGPDRPATVALALTQTTTQLSGVTVTSAAEAGAAFPDVPPTIEGLLLLTSDLSMESGDAVRRSVYEVRPGVRVTLVETRATDRDTRTRETQRERVRRSAPPAEAAPSTSSIRSVHWTSDGSDFVLSGPLTTDELDAIRRRIGN